MRENEATGNLSLSAVRHGRFVEAKDFLLFERTFCWERARPRPHHVDRRERIMSRLALSADEDVRALSEYATVLTRIDFLTKPLQVLQRIDVYWTSPQLLIAFTTRA